jgi:glutamate 5-kinase
LMHAWRDAFGEVGASVGQVLLAPLDFSHRGQYLHARGTLEALHSLQVVPIVNENDAVADEEIRFGDNDRLAALVANLVGASHLVLLTDTAGLLTADPRLDPTATLIEEVTAFDTELVDLAGVSRSGVGSGGMASKLAAARMATWSGITTVIAPDSARRSTHGRSDCRRASRGSRSPSRVADPCSSIRARRRRSNTTVAVSCAWASSPTSGTSPRVTRLRSRDRKDKSWPRDWCA